MRLERVAMKLLVIDEHPIVLQGGRELLRRAGITDILQTHDLAVGWRLYRRESPDVFRRVIFHPQASIARSANADPRVHEPKGSRRC